MHQPLQFVPVNNQLRRQIVVIERAFSEKEMDLIERNLTGISLEDAKVGPQPEEGINHNVRDSRVAWIAHEPGGAPESAWLYLALMEHVQAANVHFGLDIWGFAEHLQYSEYAAGGRYCWHMDCGVSPDEKPRPPRKVSFTLQISRPAEYEGGDLEFLLADRFRASRERGAMIIFPSYFPHRVNTVTSGLRKSLVGWVCGPEFR